MGSKVNVRRSATDALARRVWQALFELLIRSAPVRTATLARRGLTPNDSRALFSLDPRSGRSMRSLADEWQCDPSNATFIVDRLEKGSIACLSRVVVAGVMDLLRGASLRQGPQP